MTEALNSWIAGKLVAGENRRPLINPTTGALLAEAGTGGLELGSTLRWARSKGGPALRKLSFAERGKMLAAVASAVHEHREALIDLAIANGGNTRGDAKFDIDGATGTLSFYAKLGEQLGDADILVEDEVARLARNPRFVGRHVLAPKPGAAVHINAFNFPAWGMMEKAAAAWLAGMPVISKPATATCLVAVRIAEILAEANVLPEGAMQLIAGSAGDLLNHLEEQDVVAFTGSADTGFIIRSNENLLRRSVPVNVEADSLNAAVLAPDVEPGSDTWDLFLREAARDVTQKAGQKCTAIRRILVPMDLAQEAREALADEVALVKVGNPALRAVRMGPVTNAAQYEDVRKGIDTLREAGAEPFHNDGGRPELVDVDGDGGFFVAPTLLFAENPDTAAAVHEHEVFGPVSTVLPYDGEPATAAEICSRGKGSLVSSVYTDDRDFAAAALRGLAPWNGRLHLGSARIAEHSMGPGTVLPGLIHGGPGRAGGGEELGGRRGLSFYMQRTAVQGEKTLLEKILD